MRRGMDQKASQNMEASKSFISVMKEPSAKIFRNWRLRSGTLNNKSMRKTPRSSWPTTRWWMLMQTLGRRRKLSTSWTSKLNIIIRLWKIKLSKLKIKRKKFLSWSQKRNKWCQRKKKDWTWSNKERWTSVSMAIRVAFSKLTWSIKSKKERKSSSMKDRQTEEWKENWTSPSTGWSKWRQKRQRKLSNPKLVPILIKMTSTNSSNKSLRRDIKIK